MNKEDIRNLPDIELIRRYKKGNEECLTELINRYYGMICNLIYKNTRDKELAKDLTQEILLKIYGNLKNYKEGGSLISWLYSITRNHIIDYMRKNKLRNQFEIRGIINETIGGKSHPQHENKELSNYIYQGIEGLPDEQKEVFILFYFHKLSVEEIAVRLGVPKGTITSRLFLARKKLMTFLKNHGITPEYLANN